jgi:phosphoribosylformylglycinamidine synthase
MRAIVLSGTGINCDLETAAAFRLAGARTEIVSVYEWAAVPERLRDVHVLALPGGFSFGDDTGAGNALAHKLRHTLLRHIEAFVERGGLVLGVCNGFQVLVALGLLPGRDAAHTRRDARADRDPRDAALLHNEPFGFQCRWVDLEIPEGARSPWVAPLRGRRIRLPIAHGEGRFVADEGVLDVLAGRGQIALRYAGENPNGAARAIAGVSDPTGRILGLMPHPERAVSFTQRDDWTREAERLRRAGQPLPDRADGAAFFEAAARHVHAQRSDP